VISIKGDFWGAVHFDTPSCEKSNMQISKLRDILKKSVLFKDSFWAISGNGIGYALLLLSGIFVARFLGKDLYGQYGVVKTTMFYIASVATFGLNFTSTKYISELKKHNAAQVKSICQGSLNITILFSFVFAFILVVFAGSITSYLNEPDLKLSFQVLGIIVVFKSLSTTQFGLLAGFGVFKTIARNNVISGVVQFVICVLMAYLYGLPGVLGGLLFSQIFTYGINYTSLRIILKDFPNQHKHNYFGELLRFSLPIALQEIINTICKLAGVFLITKLSSAGELGLYSATSQWEVCVSFMPILLSNVILSHLSSSIGDNKRHNRTMRVMLLINFICTLIPAIIVYIFSNWIVSWYGPTFIGMNSVLNIIMFATVFNCCSNVFRAEFISIGKNWIFFSIRLLRDSVFLILAYWLIHKNEGANAAYYYAIAYAVSSVVFLLVIVINFVTISNKKTS